MVQARRFHREAGGFERYGGIVGKRLQHQHFFVIEERTHARPQLAPGDQSTHRPPRPSAEWNRRDCELRVEDVLGDPPRRGSTRAGMQVDLARLLDQLLDDG